MEELIAVRQLPIIEEHLRTMKEAIDKRVSEAVSLVCTENTLQSVKTIRTELNKDFEAMEEQRKAVKKAVLGPYEQFEAVYKECVSDAYKRADFTLKEKISQVEADMKKRCEDELRAYFSELCAAEGIDFLTFERCGVRIDMASARQKTPKKLRSQIDAFIAEISRGMQLITSLDDANEIMVEFKRTLDAAGAIAVVRERHRRMEEEKERQRLREQQVARETEAAAKVEAVAPPVVVAPPVEQEKTYRCRFSVTATKSQLRKLKEFMIKEGIKYE